MYKKTYLLQKLFLVGVISFGLFNGNICNATNTIMPSEYTMDYNIEPWDEEQKIKDFLESEKNKDKLSRFINDKRLGKSFFHIAVEMHDIETIELLVENGADINDPDLGGFTPLDCAENAGNSDVQKYLISIGAVSGSEFKKLQ